MTKPIYGPSTLPTVQDQTPTPEPKPCVLCGELTQHSIPQCLVITACGAMPTGWVPVTETAYMKLLRDPAWCPVEPHIGLVGLHSIKPYYCEYSPYREIMYTTIRPELVLPKPPHGVVRNGLYVHWVPLYLKELWRIRTEKPEVTSRCLDVLKDTELIHMLEMMCEVSTEDTVRSYIDSLLKEDQ